MLHDPKTVNGSDFDQETAEKIAPQFIARLELANCSCSEDFKTFAIYTFDWQKKRKIFPFFFHSVLDKR